MTIWTPLEGTDIELGNVRYCPAVDLQFIGKGASTNAAHTQLAAPRAESQEATKSVTPQRGFCIVQAVPLGADDFEVVGVFSKREDADQYLAELQAAPDLILEGVGAIQEGITMDVIKRALAADRLGKLAASIERLLEAAPTRQP